MLAQGQSYSHHPSPRPLYDRINQRGDDETKGGVLDEPAPHSLLTPLDENGGGGSYENAAELERDIQLAFEEQEKSLSATAPAPTILIVPLLSHHTLGWVRKMIKAKLVTADYRGLDRALHSAVRTARRSLKSDSSGNRS